MFFLFFYKLAEKQSERLALLMYYIEGTEDYYYGSLLYSAILRSHEQTHCARMWFYISE